MTRRDLQSAPLGDRIQYSIHHPSHYICTHLKQLLPQWSIPVQSMLVLLQPTTVSLSSRTCETEQEKQHLRWVFLDVGSRIVSQLQAQGYLSDLFDPKTGKPVLSQPGSASLDDVAVVHACLGYPLIFYGNCRSIHHPDWGNAVYPAVLVSAAPLSRMQAVVPQIIEAWEAAHPSSRLTLH